MANTNCNIATTIAVFFVRYGLNGFNVQPNFVPVFSLISIVSAISPATRSESMNESIMMYVSSCDVTIYLLNYISYIKLGLELRVS